MRIGEIAVSRGGGALVAVGLGSCIGLALLDRTRGVAGLAHVMLPASRAGAEVASDGKFADVAVPALLARLAGHGARRGALGAVLVGGAQMFETSAGSGLDIGARNEEAVLSALARERIPVLASATGGRSGRTVRVDATRGEVSVREAGGAPHVVLSGGRP